ncbi:hypothetical protein Y032_0004g1878 [Ancylostoma ceylanicum]|uniref:Uncharacterized protein n=1 Tax=Ancylostoma ceylanicum TaxID=53326 RepID=A0A016VVB5_9BILA|nr:hypothetical protein Y032_0004g1878 [Ancylostoma ceylanicum]
MANWTQCFVMDPVKPDIGAERLSFCLQVLHASKISAGNTTTITFWRALFVITSETLPVSLHLLHLFKIAENKVFYVYLLGVFVYSIAIDIPSETVCPPERIIA